ncbi:hypothetical protein FRB95_010253 [Tulasnella sp. JGI-2019a]|nr:hypothetical protein FRB95_010253 [Tulasnella sp. JGI-2019a]
MGWVVDSLNSDRASSTWVSLSLDSSHFFFPEMQALTLICIQSLQTIVSLSLAGRRDWVDRALQDLASPTILVDGNLVWVWPNLTELLFEKYTGSPVLVLAMVRGRMEAWAAWRAGGGGIARLENFRVGESAMDADSFEKIQTILGKEKSYRIATK